jgi:hypothetical protein
MLKMFWGIFALCRHSDRRLDVFEQRMEIVHRNQEIIHSHWNEPLQEFPDVPIFPPVPDPYASLIPAELLPLALVPLVLLLGMTMIVMRKPMTTMR